MENRSPGSAEVLRAAILADARHEADALIARAKEQARTLLAESLAAAASARQERLDRARAEAARRRDSMLATVPVEAAQFHASRVEAVLQSVKEEAGRRLRNRLGFDIRQAIVALAVEAIQPMAGSAFVIRLSPEDCAAVGTGLVGEILHRLGRPNLRVSLSQDATVTGGPIVQNPDGSQVWDNRLDARLARLWPDLRQQIAQQSGLLEPDETTGVAP